MNPVNAIRRTAVAMAMPRLAAPMAAGPLLCTPLAAAPGLMPAVTSVRHFGLLDKISSGIKAGFSEKTEAKKREMFQTQINFLWNNGTYSMPEHVTLLRDVLAKGGLTEGKNSWLKGEERKREEEEMMLDLKIGEAIVASESTREEWWGQEKGGDVGRADIHRRDKLRLSGVIGCDVARINRFLDAYAQSCAVHSMLQRRKGRGLPLPEGEERVSEVLREERGGEGKAGSSSRKTAMQAQMGNVRTTRSMLKKL